jgi:hypothetical protein
MTFGAYFIPEEEWAAAVAIGLDYCAWPPIIPDSKGTGEGFVTKRVLVDLRTGKETRYERDEVPDPKRLTEPKGAFVTLGRRELGLNAKDLSAKYEPAIVNYFLHKDPDWRAIEQGVVTAYRCAEAWEGRRWTAVVPCNWGGLMDRVDETETVPTHLLVEQIDLYRELGCSRILWWRWDTPKGRAGVEAVMTKVRNLREAEGLDVMKVRVDAVPSSQPSYLPIIPSTTDATAAALKVKGRWMLILRAAMGHDRDLVARVPLTVRLVQRLRNELSDALPELIKAGIKGRSE